MYICSLGAELFYYGVALSSDCNPAFDFTAVKAVCTHMTVAEIHVYIQVIIQVYSDLSNKRTGTINEF